MSRTRNISDGITLFKQAEQRAGKAPRVIITDGLKVYPDATEQVFGSEKRHISSTPFTDKDITNIIERYQGKLKDRTGIMRGFKDVV
jgi:transposase-like protein